MRYLTALLLVCTLLVGSVPQNLSYQGFIKASDGTLLPDGAYTVTFRIYEGVTGGVSLWSEEHEICLLYTSPSPRDRQKSRMPSSA